MGVKDEVLLKTSNAYAFYKDNYKRLSETNKNLNKEIKLYKMHINLMNRELKEKRNELNSKKRTIRSLESDVKQKNKHIKFLENEFTNMSDTLEENSKLKTHEEYRDLIEAFEHRMRALNSSHKKELKDLNIGYVLRGFPILSETFIVSEVRWLIENGFNVKVFTFIDSYKPVILDFFVENIRYKTNMELKTELLRNDIDLVHTHFVYPTCTENTYPVCEELGIPFTVFAHAYDIFRHNEDRINKIGEISQSPYCKAVFTLSEYHKNYLMKRHVVEDKIVITKQASDYELQPIEMKTGEIKNIISISRLVEKKGLDDLIDAAKLLEGEDFEFSIYGFGDQQKHLQEKIDELECKNISLKGELEHNEVGDLLKNSDLLVAPCKIDKDGDRDGFPTVIFEAMAAGLPVLTTDVSAIPELISDGVNGFLTPSKKPELLAERIKQIATISNEDLFKIRKQAQHDVKDISSVDKTMEKYIETIDSL